MQERLPRVSVIIGFRDWGVERLRLAVRSHRGSTLAAELEIIVVDYGSRDAAGVRHAVEQEGGRLLRVEAGGRPWSRARALNHGIRQAARGQIILTTDSDILFGARTAETIFTEMDRASGREGTYALVQCRDLPPSYPEAELPDFDWASMEAKSTLRPRYGMGGCACFPRSVVETVRGYDERMEWWGAEDKDLASRAEAAGLEIRWVEHPDARIYHLWHEKIPEKHRDDDAFQETWARNQSYLAGSRTRYRNLDEWGGRSSPAVPVSVVIAARGRADRLERAIDSVLAQSYQNFELLVVDDGSEGKAREIAESFSDPRIRWLAPPDPAVHDPANPGVRTARGAHVYVLDERDRMLPGCLEDHLYAILPRSAGSFGGRIELSGKSRDLRYHPEKRSALDARGFSPNGAPAPGIMMRRELALRATEADPKSGSGGDLGSRPAQGGRVFEHTGTYVLLRQTPESKPPVAAGAEAKHEGAPQALPLAPGMEIDLPRVSRPEIARLFPELFAPPPKWDGAGARSGRERSPQQPALPSRPGLTRGLFSRRAHLVFLLMIAALGGMLAAAWFSGIIGSGGFVLGVTVLGGIYALGILMLWLERSIAHEVNETQLVLANRIEATRQQIEQAVKDQTTGMRAQQAEDARHAAAQVKTLTNLIRASRTMERLEPGSWTMVGSGEALDDFLYLTVRCISDSRPRTIVELGTGPATVTVAACLARLGMDAAFHSIGHDRHRLDEIRQSLRKNGIEERVELALAPISETRFGRFYGIDAWIASLECVDLLIVGGPPLDLGPQIRRPAKDYFHPVLSDGAMVLIDDGRLESERDHARRWKAEHPELSLELVDNLRGCFLLRKPAAMSPFTCFDLGSQFLAAPRCAPSTTRIVFIGGLITTGTTALKAALMACDFATSTGKYGDGRHDPDCPSPWPEGSTDPASPASEAFQAWIESYCRGPWLIEKTPDRYLHFLAIEKRLGPDRSVFLMTRRDPYQALACIQRRCPERYGLGPGHPPGHIQADDPGLVRRLHQAIDFHERRRPLLRNFRYVRYEDLCTDPKGTLSTLLALLGVGVGPRVLDRAARLAQRDIRHYPITIEAEGVREAANRLCRLWAYPER